LGSPEKKRQIFYFTVRIFTEGKCEIFPLFNKCKAIKKQGKEKKKLLHTFLTSALDGSEQLNATGPGITG